MMECPVCGAELNPEESMCCRIQRGYFNDLDGDYIKADTYICMDCYLKDEDLCRFFNKIGRTVR
jgi:hypothetical protein